MFLEFLGCPSVPLLLSLPGLASGMRVELRFGTGLSFAS